MNKQSNLSTLSKVLLFLSSVCLIISAYVPIWRIELAAPQYPEGLALQIFANKIGGDVEIINGLNHYIGMATLHTENFIEFSILTYIIWAYALVILLTIFMKSKKMLIFSFVAFLVFGIVAMVDFYRWNYNYGHNLDPNAAIIVPGMAYQPPLIGYKQLLNFGAYSIPDIGGWLFIVCFTLLTIALYIETKFSSTKKSSIVISTYLLIATSSVTSCTNIATEPIKLNKDECASCKMSIADANFATELITKKGRVYKFDDAACMAHYLKDNPTIEVHSCYISNFIAPHNLLATSKIYLISGDEINSPMGGNIAAFENEESAKEYIVKYNASPIKWENILK